MYLCYVRTLDCTGVAALDHDSQAKFGDPSVILESTRPGNKARPAPRQPRPKGRLSGIYYHTYFDVSSHAKSHRQSSLSKCYRKLSVSEKLSTPPSHPSATGSKLWQMKPPLIFL